MHMIYKQSQRHRIRWSNIYEHSAPKVEAVSSPSLKQRNRAASSTQKGGKNVFASFLERVRYRDVQEGEKHRPDTDMFGESTTSSLDVGCLSGYESISIVHPM